MIAALFIDPKGLYPKMSILDCWDQERDARKYKGPYPVIAHPPCQLWGKLALINYKRYGGEHNKPGNDGGCFAAAVRAVRKWGGVLEHPAYSYAFEAHGLPKPKHGSWQEGRKGEWVCCVWQSAYGHLANKATWLFYVGDQKPPEADWRRPVGTHQCGQGGLKPSLRGRRAIATPPAFAAYLLQLAFTARSVKAAA